MKKLLIYLLAIFLVSCTTTKKVPKKVDEELSAQEMLCDIFTIDNQAFNSDVSVVVNVRIISYVGEVDVVKIENVLNNDFNDMKIHFNVVESVEGVLDFTDNYVGFIYKNSVQRINYNTLLMENNTSEYLDISILPDDLKLIQEIHRNSVIMGAAAGVPELRNTALGYTSLFIRDNVKFTKILSHEVGHVFGLKHTFHANDLNNNGLNCGTGDGIPDTANVTSLAKVGNSTCTLYIPEVVANNLTEEQKRNIVENIMSYSPPQCLLEFTEGQAQAVRKMVEINPRIQETLR